MTERYKAQTDLVVAGRAYRKGETFTTSVDLTEALARGMVIRAPANGRRKKKK